ncbi:MAG: hypothetical protein ACP5O2_11335 [Bacteroidales bacterium]
MNRIFIILLMFMGLTVSASRVAQLCDQDDKDKWEKIKARKVAYMTSKLDLTVQESQAFWPLYNEYSDKRDKLLFELYPKLSDEEINLLMNLSDKEAAERMDAYFNKQAQLNSLEKEYNQKFRKILPEHKVLRMYMAEMLFRKELLNDLRNSGPTKNSKPHVKPK